MNTDETKRYRTRILSLVLFISIFTITIGSVSQAVLEYLDLRKYQPDGKFLSLDGYDLYLNCRGEGAVTILLESDLTFPSLQWTIVQRELSRQHRVCSYDRPGLGWSDESPLPRRGMEMVEELFRLVRKANIEGQLVLVGYGRGTWLTRLFTFRYPELVSQLILVDPAFENSLSRFPTSYKSKWEENTNLYPFMQTATWSGATRFWSVLGGLDWFKQPFSLISQDIRSEILAFTLFKSSYWDIANQELVAVSEINESLTSITTLGTTPIYIITNYSALSDQTIVDLYQASIFELTKYSSNTSIIECDSCGSMPPITDPDLITDIITNIVSLSP